MYTLLAIAGIAGLVVLLLVWGIRRRKAMSPTGQDPLNQILIYLAWAALGAIVFGVVGFGLIFLLGPVVYSEDPLFAAIVGGAFGTPIAAVIGAIVGALIARKRLARRQTSKPHIRDRFPLAELDPETLRYIIRHGRDHERRRQALAELEKRGMVDPQ